MRSAYNAKIKIFIPPSLISRSKILYKPFKKATSVMQRVCSNCIISTSGDSTDCACEGTVINKNSKIHPVSLAFIIKNSLGKVSAYNLHNNNSYMCFVGIYSPYKSQYHQYNDVNNAYCLFHFQNIYL